MRSTLRKLLAAAKKQFRLPALIAIITASLLLASCGDKDQTILGGDSEESEQANPVIILATTTSTQDSGLLDELVPIFEKETGYLVKVIAVGTGQALKMGSRGDADVLFVHAPAAEMELVESGDAVNRQLVMHNDFVIVGPEQDPAGLRSAAMPEDALASIVANGALFISRGDDSGTHKRELSLWEKLGQEPNGPWYLESGQGMGATLRIASEKEGYTLTDRATYLALQDTIESEILFEDDPSLLNIYHVMQVNPERWPAVNADGAEAWVQFLVSDRVQEIIDQFRVEELGQQLFFPDAGKSESELLGEG